MDALTGEILRSITSSGTSIVAVAGKICETLVIKNVLSIAEAQGLLASMAEECRDDGDLDGSHIARFSYAIAGGLEERALALPKNVDAANPRRGDASS